jgi:hypothetical protein
MYTNLQKALEKLFVAACNFRRSSYYSKRRAVETSKPFKRGKIRRVDQI